MVAGHAQGVDRQQGLLAGDVGKRLRTIGQGKDRQPRQADAWRPPAGGVGDRREQVAQQDVLAAEDIALADPAALEGEQMTLGDVVDMREVEASVDKGGNLAARGVEKNAAGRLVSSTGPVAPANLSVATLLV